MRIVKRNFSTLKKSKAFYIFDIAVYGFIAAAVCTLFLCAFLFNNGASAQGFRVTVDNKLAAEYSFNDGKFTVQGEFAAHFLQTEDGVYFYPNADDKSEYNLITFNRANRTAFISQATCTGRDCTAQKVSAQGGFIFCAPHNLKIVPTGLTDPVSG